MSEDPFACFGSDDEEDDDINEEIEQNNSKKDAILLAMKKKNDSNNNNINQMMQTPALFSESHNINAKKELYVNESSNLLWPNIYPPLYIGPMEIRSTNQPIQTTTMKEGKTDHSITNGGGRGFFATQDLQPGTLLLVENPAFYWPENQLGKHLGMLSIHAMFHNDNMKNSLKKKTQDLVQCMEELHPTKVNVDKAFGLLDNAEAGTTDDEVLLQKNDQIYGMMNFLMKGYYHDNASQDTERKLVDEILETSRENKITSSNGKSLNIHDIYRMLLQLRYNGFGSGLYLNFSMFNHNDDANCIKLLPPNAVDDAADNNDNDKDVDSSNKTSSYSEVRTTKYVKKGQELTLHYLNTREQIVSHATRRQHFMTQHLFDIGDLEKENCNNKLYKMELVSGSIPPSNAQSPLTESSIETNRDNDDVCLRIENTLQEMEDLLNDLSLAITIERLQKQQQLQQQQKEQTSSSSTSNSTDEAMKALEQSSLELIQESINQLQNRDHILLLRCYRLHLDCCEILSSPSSSILTKKQEIQLHLRSLHSSQQLLKLQILYLGNFHPDVAETYNDLSQSIHILLSMDPNSLFTFDDDVFNNEDGKGNSEVSNMKEKNKQKTNFSYWSRKEAEYKKEFNRISSFYPRDTHEYIDVFRKNVLVK